MSRQQSVEPECRSRPCQKGSNVEIYNGKFEMVIAKGSSDEKRRSRKTSSVTKISSSLVTCTASCQDEEEATGDSREKEEKQVNKQD